MQCELCTDEADEKCDCCELFYCRDCVEWIEWKLPIYTRVSSYCWSEGWAHKSLDIDFLRIKGFIDERLVGQHGPYKPCASIPSDV
jgi:hypothetical protein